MTDVEARIAALEEALGQRLPAEYCLFLLKQKEQLNRPPQVVATNPDYWDVRSLFEIGSGAENLQVDVVYRLVGDVVPLGMIPVGEDSGGNLYLLDARSRSESGVVYWWDHEQELGEDRVEEVADSFNSFLALLVADAS